MSAPGVPQVLATAGLEIVAYANDPVVGLQVVPEVSNAAPEHASLEGGVGGDGSVMQMSKFPFVAGALPLVENILT